MALPTIDLAGTEALARLGTFVVVLGAMSLWEIAGRRRELRAPRPRRWRTNLGLSLVDTAIVRLCLPGAAVTAALVADAASFGFLRIVPLPPAVAGVVAFVALDLTVYAQHVILHAVPVLWRVHRVHHADLDVDATTGIRFHPVEIVLSMLLKIGVVAALGPPVVAVVVFEAALNATSMFSHGNVHIPVRFDRWLRRIVVTPDVHRVHHSVRPEETGSNFGFNLPWWDRLFGTYRAEPEDGHERMEIGLAEERDAAAQTLLWALARPFRPSLRSAGSDRARSARAAEILGRAEALASSTRSPRRRSRS